IHHFADWPLEIFSMQPLSDFLIHTISAPWILILIAFILLYFAINLFSKVIYRLLIGKSENKLNAYIFDNPYKSFGWGLLITAAIQSSSVTTSLTVPLVATGRISVKKVLPFI